jgi:integrase
MDESSCTELVRLSRLQETHGTKLMLRTKSGLPKHCTYQTDRYGKRRVRFRRRGISVYLSGIPWSEDFMRQYAAALEREDSNRARIAATKRTLPGSFSALCVSYYGSPEFRGLAALTQQTRRNILERFRAEHGHRPLKDLQPTHIRKIIGAKSDTPEAANNLLKVLRTILKYAVSERMITSNPATDVKRYTSRGDGIHAWTEKEVAQFEAHHAIGRKARLAFALLLYTAQRRGDVVRMGWQHVHGDAIAVRQEKTDTPLLIPIHPELARALAAVPRSNLTFLLTERGAPFTPAGFGNWFRDRCNEAALRECSAHGLRKCAATRLADLGCSLHQIMAVTGHKSMSSVAPYTKRADQARLAREAFKIQLGAEREQNLPNMETHVYPTAKK